MNVFKTFKPKNHLLQKYISYYYVDIADRECYFNEYICYPHFNNTISFYRNHILEFTKEQSNIYFKEDAAVLQIFTPIRENQLKVSQNGPIFKIAIVFNPFGVNQFLPRKIQLNQLQSSPDFEFLSNEILSDIFNLPSYNEIIEMLEAQLIRLWTPIQNVYIENALQLIHNGENSMSINELAEKKLGISRKQFTRLFQQYLGINPQKYCAIVRFRQFMNHKLAQRQYSNFSRLCHRANYTDQSHLIKSCKQFTELTPSNFFKDGQIIGSEDTFWKFIG